MNTNQIVCKNCGSEQVAEFCSNCGQKTITKRFTTRSFFLKFLSAFNFERGFFYTMKLLFTNPGKVVNGYLSGKTKSYYNPLNYLFITAGVGAALAVWLGIFDANIENVNEVFGVGADKNAVNVQKKFMEHFKQYINIVSITMLPFMSLFSKWFYLKRKLFYGEHLILNSFLFAQTSVISILLMPFYITIPVLASYYSTIGFVTIIIYYSYALKSVFKNTVIKSILGSFTIFIGGYLLFMIFFMVIMFGATIIMVISGTDLKDLLQ